MNIKPKIIAEKYLENFDGEIYVYKVFCFNGKAESIMFLNDRQRHLKMSFYDLNWNKLNVQYGNHIVGDALRPKHFEEMKEISEKLSRDLPFVRVDFFDTDDHLYVAELTLYPGGGYTPYKPESFNEKMGELFELPTDKKL
jgi:hypothetical protein